MFFLILINSLVISMKKNKMRIFFTLLDFFYTNNSILRFREIFQFFLFLSGFFYLSFYLNHFISYNEGELVPSNSTVGSGSSSWDSMLWWGTVAIGSAAVIGVSYFVWKKTQNVYSNSDANNSSLNDANNSSLNEDLVSLQNFSDLKVKNSVNLIIKVLKQKTADSATKLNNFVDDPYFNKHWTSPSLGSSSKKVEDIHIDALPNLKKFLSQSELDFQFGWKKDIFDCLKKAYNNGNGENETILKNVVIQIDELIKQKISDSTKDPIHAINEFSQKFCMDLKTWMANDTDSINLIKNNIGYLVKKKIVSKAIQNQSEAMTIQHKVICSSLQDKLANLNNCGENDGGYTCLKSASNLDLTGLISYYHHQVADLCQLKADIIALNQYNISLQLNLLKFLSKKNYSPSTQLTFEHAKLFETYKTSIELEKSFNSCLQSLESNINNFMLDHCSFFCKSYKDVEYMLEFLVERSGDYLKTDSGFLDLSQICASEKSVLNIFFKNTNLTKFIKFLNTSDEILNGRTIDNVPRLKTLVNDFLNLSTSLNDCIVNNYHNTNLSFNNFLNQTNFVKGKLNNTISEINNIVSNYHSFYYNSDIMLKLQNSVNFDKDCFVSLTNSVFKIVEKKNDFLFGYYIYQDYYLNGIITLYGKMVSKISINSTKFCDFFKIDSLNCDKYASLLNKNVDDALNLDTKLFEKFKELTTDPNNEVLVSNLKEIILKVSEILLNDLGIEKTNDFISLFFS